MQQERLPVFVCCQRLSQVLTERVSRVIVDHSGKLLAFRGRLWRFRRRECGATSCCSSQWFGFRALGGIKARSGLLWTRLDRMFRLFSILCVPQLRRKHQCVLFRRSSRTSFADSSCGFSVLCTCPTRGNLRFHDQYEDPKERRLWFGSSNSTLDFDHFLAWE